MLPKFTRGVPVGMTQYVSKKNVKPLFFTMQKLCSIFSFVFEQKNIVSIFLLTHYNGLKK